MTLNKLLCVLGIHKFKRTHEGKVGINDNKFPGLFTVETCRCCSKQRGTLHTPLNKYDANPTCLIDCGKVKSL